MENNEQEYVPFGEEWAKEMKKFKKDELIDQLRTVLNKNEFTPRQLQLYRELGKIREVIENLKEPLKFVDLMRNDDDPRKVMADIKHTIGQIQLQLALQEMKEVAHPTKKPIQDNGFGKQGAMVGVRPCSEEYGNKTYIGFMIGEVATSSSIGITDTKIQLEFARHNPAIFVPELGKVIYGYESWWGEIKSEDDFKDITDEDIENVWYVKAYRQMLEKDGAGED